MNDQVAATRYSIRPALREGESLGGWCWQIYSVNDLNVPAVARAAISNIRTTQVLTQENALSQLIGFERLHPHQERERSLLSPWSGQLSPRWYAWSRRPRFCPLCMAEDECHLLYWDLPLVSACALHGCHLTTMCHLCRTTWKWATMKHGWRCRCGVKIADGPAKAAPLHEIRFSRVLCEAADALAPQAVKAASAGSALVGTDYRTQDVYEVLGWLLKARRVLTDKIYYGAAKLWPVTQRRGARMVPGSWEKRLMMRLPFAVDHKARLTLRWFFKGATATLVDLQSVDRWRYVKKLMNELSAERNPMLGPILGAVERAQKEYFAGMPGETTMLFNPRLSLDERNRRLAELSAWLRTLVGNESENVLIEQPAQQPTLGRQVFAPSDQNREER
jgi:hypothetical protein